MSTYSELGDRLIGDTIVCEARQIKTKPPIYKTGRHKAQRIVLKDNAEATITKKARFIKRNPYVKKIHPL